MNKMFSGAMAGLVAVASVLTAVPAAAQYRDSDRDGRSDRREWNRDRDRDGRPDQWDHRDNRRDQVDRRDNRRQQYRWNTYGGRYGYNGYRGRWREGQRFNHWNNSRYYVNDWGRYDLPPPRRGYRYYRDDNGDIVMAAIATGVIGLILGSQIGR
jgi:Ni/Co efflux regulator RcnB